MFVDIAPAPPPAVAPQTLEIGIKGGPGAVFSNFSVGGAPLGPVAEPPSRDAFYWTLFSIILLLMMLCFILNLFLTIVLARSTLQNHCCSFYKIMLAFVATIVVSSSSDIVCMVYFEGMQNDLPMLGSITLIVSLIVSYYMTILIFLLGLNRFAAFCSPRLNASIMKSKQLCILLAILLLFSVLVGVLVYKLCGFSRSFDSDKNRVMNSAQDTVLLTISNYIFYTIPLISTVFYVICFISLRSQRSLVTTGKTMLLLDKAEKSTLKQGIVILVFYMVRGEMRIKVRKLANSTIAVISRDSHLSSLLPTRRRVVLHTVSHRDCDFNCTSIGDSDHGSGIFKRNSGSFSTPIRMSSNTNFIFIRYGEFPTVKDQFFGICSEKIQRSKRTRR
ncbi:hypothetical protein Y032_0447g1632 [Ancylostoma ceylanicum]|uniref:G-protein coupled receptors family 1 profile domain-containing protein n=1 Tax=Ancylostoma ceylanicum TaxID=53326 RepID=A0A016WYY9_9BILA|nr:hypothetical protein Y032_0447g1632 [Ancylostoma ceylanicum]